MVKRRRRSALQYLSAAFLVAIAAVICRAFPDAPLSADFILLSIGPALIMATGGRSAALLGLILAALLAPVTPLRALGPVSRLDVLFIDLLVAAAVYGLRAGRESARERSATEEILQAILQTDSNGIVVMSRSGRVIYASREAERICGPEIRAGHTLGPASTVRLMTPDGRQVSAPDLIATNRSGAGEQRNLVVLRSDQQRTWIQYRAVPVHVGAQAIPAVVLVFSNNLTRSTQQAGESYDDLLRKRRDEREEMFQRISQHLRGSLDPHHIQSVAAEELGNTLQADRCFFLLFNIGEHGAVLGPQWSSPDTPLLMDEYSPVEIDVARLYRRGVTRISHDMRSSSLPSSLVSVFEDKLGVRSAINVPLYQGEGSATAALVVAMASEPRAWSADEVAVAELVASQTRFVIEAARLLAAERSHAEREQLSNRIGSALRSTLDPSSIQSEATNELGRALHADRCYYIQYDLQACKATVGPDYTRGSHTLTLTGDYDLPDDSLTLHELSLARGTLVVEDVENTDPLQGSAVVTLKTEPVKAFIRVPIFIDKTPVAALIVAMSNAARQWSADEVALVESVATQTSSAIRNAQLIARERARAEREELLSRITIAIGQAKSVREAQGEATKLLGSRLHADRCYVIEMNYYRDMAVIASEYRRQDIEPVIGSYPLGDRDLHWLTDLAASGQPRLVGDLRKSLTDESRLSAGAASLLSHRHRALLIVPQILGGRVESLLVLASAEKPREWSREEVELAVEVAVRMRVALQSAVTHEREHKIALTLQDALLPNVPSDLPGLTVATHYHAALMEASIGGDFYDAFKISPTKTTLCVGDVSGKGLVAAAQLSSLRNMLRAMLYREGVTAGAAVTELNATVAQHKLLSGFATMFVGIYDSTHRRLAYVSCGQEPAILLRAAGGNPRILAATSPALGIFEEEIFEEGSILLGKGDLLLLYTDGVAEAGKNVRGMLGTEGIAQIIVESAATGGNDTQQVLNEIVQRVEGHAEGVFRDDMCFLLARA